MIDLELVKALVHERLIPHDGNEEGEGEEEGCDKLHCASPPDEDDGARHEELLDHDHYLKPPWCVSVFVEASRLSVDRLGAQGGCGRDGEEHETGRSQRWGRGGLARVDLRV